MVLKLSRNVLFDTHKCLRSLMVTKLSLVIFSVKKNSSKVKPKNSLMRILVKSFTFCIFGLTLDKLLFFNRKHDRYTNLANGVIYSLSIIRFSKHLWVPKYIFYDNLDTIWKFYSAKNTFSLSLRQFHHLHCIQYYIWCWVASLVHKSRRRLCGATWEPARVA